MGAIAIVSWWLSKDHELCQLSWHYNLASNLIQQYCGIVLKIQNKYIAAVSHDFIACRLMHSRVCCFICYYVMSYDKLQQKLLWHFQLISEIISAKFIRSSFFFSEITSIVYNMRILPESISLDFWCKQLFANLLIRFDCYKAWIRDRGHYLQTPQSLS